MSRFPPYHIPHELRKCKICGIPDHYPDGICYNCRKREQNARHLAKRKKEISVHTK